MDTGCTEMVPAPYSSRGARDGVDNLEDLLIKDSRAISAAVLRDLWDKVLA